MRKSGRAARQGCDSHIVILHITYNSATSPAPPSPPEPCGYCHTHGLTLSPWLPCRTSCKLALSKSALKAYFPT